MRFLFSICYHVVSTFSYFLSLLKFHEIKNNKVNNYSLLIGFHLFFGDILGNQSRRHRTRRENNFSAKQYTANNIRKSSVLEKVNIFYMLFSCYEYQIIFIFEV